MFDGVYYNMVFYTGWQYKSRTHFELTVAVYCEYFGVLMVLSWYWAVSLFGVLLCSLSCSYQEARIELARHLCLGSLKAVLATVTFIGWCLSITNGTASRKWPLSCLCGLHTRYISWYRIFGLPTCPSSNNCTITMMNKEYFKSYHLFSNVSYWTRSAIISK